MRLDLTESTFSMRGEKPDTSRQSTGFDDAHAGLTVGQIIVERGQLRMFRASDHVREVRAQNRDPIFDYLPVQDTGGHLIGLLSNQAIDSASRDNDNAEVGEYLDPLSEADLIGARTPIATLIDRIRKKPFLVVSDQEVIGMVTWSDLQKLPVRTALFALVTGFELTMYEAINRHFEKRADWTKCLDKCRLCKAEKKFREQSERGSDVDLLLCTQFCDKRDILIKSFDFAQRIGIGKKKLEKRFRAIEDVRNNLAHASNYAMSFEKAEQLRATLRNLRELRSHLNSLAR